MKTTESGGVRGYYNGKTLNGRKRHAVVDTIGLLVGLVVHAADIQDRDGAPAVLASIRRSCPWLRRVFADGGYAGPKLRGAPDRIGEWTIKIIKLFEPPRVWRRRFRLSYAAAATASICA